MFDIPPSPQPQTPKAPEPQGPPLPHAPIAIPPQPSVKQPSPAAPPAATPLKSEHITVMPQKFYVPPKNPTPWGKILFGISTVVVVGGGIVAAAWYVTRRLQPPELPTTPPGSSITPPTTQAPDITTPATSDQNAVVISPPSSPDVIVPPSSPDSVADGEGETSEDSDSDELTTTEEQLYGTDPAKSDTDQDGYADGRELKNLYSPNDPNATRRLWETGVVNKYEHPQGAYQLLYPAGWTARATDVDAREVLFTSSTGEFITITIEENFNGQSPQQWYAAQSQGASQALPEAITTRSGWQGAKGPQGLSAVIEITGTPTRLLVARYIIGARPQASFASTFAMMIASLQQGSSYWPFAVGSQRPAAR